MISDLKSRKANAVASEAYLEAADLKDELDAATDHESEIRELFHKKEAALAAEEYLKVDEIISQILSIIMPVSELPSNRPEPVTLPFPVPDTPLTLPPIVEEVPPAPPPEPFENSFFLTQFGPREQIVAPTIETATPKPKAIFERVPQFGHARILPNFDEPPPKPEDVNGLNEENRQEADPLIQLFGEPTVAAAYSQTWNNKVEGYRRLCESVQNLKTQREQLIGLRAMIPLMRRRFSEGLKAVYCSAVESTIGMLDALNISGTQLHDLDLLPLVIAKLGHSNQRINESAMQFVIWVADRDPKQSLNEVIQYAVKPPPDANQYHLFSAKLTLLKTLIPKYGINPPGRIKLKDIMDVILPCLESRKEELRRLSFELLVQMNVNVDRYLINMPRIKEQLKAVLEKGKVEPG
jgi:hypothetical protein